MLALTLLLSGCAAETQTEPEATRVVAPDDPDLTEPPSTEIIAEPDPVEEILASMTVEQKVGQLILARIDSDADKAIKNLKTYHVGGYVLFASDFIHERDEKQREKRRKKDHAYLSVLASALRGSGLFGNQHVYIPHTDKTVRRQCRGTAPE